MHVMVLGLRGFPDVQGGVERHAEQLYPLMARLGCEVEVLVRSPHHPPGKPLHWNGVRFRRLWSPRANGFEALIHSFLATLYAVVRRPDVLHIHAVGPALLAPLARMLGLRVVVTHHGADYDREKWGRLARWVLRTGERWGMGFAHERIVISEVIRRHVAARYGRDSVVIPNGVHIPPSPGSAGALCRFALAPGRYVLQVSRLVPEKRQLDLIHAFAEARIADWKLVLVGGIAQPDAYAREVIALAERTPGVVLTGFQSGSDLQQLYAHAGLFVLPSSHEGLPIALLEALSFGLPVLASDIPANLDVGLPSGSYFPLGDVAALAKTMRARAASCPLADEERRRIRAWVAERFDWNDIARRTLEVYRGVVGRQDAVCRPQGKGAKRASRVAEQ